MLIDPEGILEAAVTAISLEDIDSTVAYFDPDADFTVFAQSKIVFQGREAITARLRAILKDFHVDRFVARTILPAGDGLRTQIEYAFRHRTLGVTIDGTMRVIANFKDGRIVRWHEYQDAERAEAFRRLVMSASAEQTPRGDDKPA